MTNPYQTLEDREFDSHYRLDDIDIDRPVEEVWPHAVEIGRWMDTHVLETIDGSATEVGHLERVWPRNLGDDLGEPRYHLYGVAYVIPSRYIALEVFPEKGGSYGNARPWVSFDGILLTDLGDGRTRVTFLLIDVHQGKGDRESYERRATEILERRIMTVRHLGNLKRIVESA